MVSLYLFGSHAEDRAHRESDIDLGVLFDRGALPGARGRFDAALLLSTRLQAALAAGRSISSS